MEQILTVDDVAKMLQMSKSTIYKYAERGIIPSIKIGTSLRFKDEQIKQFVSACTPSSVQEIAGV